MSGDDQPVYTEAQFLSVLNDVVAYSDLLDFIAQELGSYGSIDRATIIEIFREWHTRGDLTHLLPDSFRVSA